MNKCAVIAAVTALTVVLSPLPGCNGSGGGGGGASAGGLASGSPPSPPSSPQPATSAPATSASRFGVFGAFTAFEFGPFCQAAGFSKDDYMAWASAHMKELGAHWTRSNLQLIWDEVEPTVGGARDWNALEADDIIRAVHAPGNEVHFLAVFLTGRNLRNPLDRPDEYKAFVRAAVERYDGDGVDDLAAGVRVTHWQVGNEVFEWEQTGRGAQEYAAWVRLVREAALAADPEARIVLMAPADDSAGRQVSTFLQDVIVELAPERAFDVIDVHHWGRAGDWQMPAVAEYRRLLDSLGLTHVEIWSAENGTWQGQPTQDPVLQSEEEQARSLVKRYVYNLNHGLDKLFWNNLVEWDRFMGQTGSIYNSMGLITDGRGPGEDPSRFNTERVAYWTYRTLAAHIDVGAARPLGAISGLPAQVHGYSYERLVDGRRFSVLWSEGGAQNVPLRVTRAGVHVTSLIPDRFGAVLFEEDVTAVGGVAVVTVADDPLLVVEQ